jgi:hypothetical protein
LHEAIAGAKLGGVGSGVSPRTALAVGLKVDMTALPADLIRALKRGEVNLDDPATTLSLLRLNAVVGLTGFFEGNSLRSIGIQRSLCHSTVDNALTAGIGRRLDGWAARDLNIGAIAALAPNLQPVADLLGVDVGTVQKVLNSWGPGKFDAELFLDGKAFRPDGRSAATLIPPAFGLAGVNLHTWTGWGSVTHWNALVANLEMHGKGTFYDPRLDDAAQFPIAERAGFANVRSSPDLVTPKLAALHFYQLAIPAPAAPTRSFDWGLPNAAGHFQRPGTLQHVPRPAALHRAWLEHAHARGDRHRRLPADRSPDRRYRTAPLKGLWTHTKGGFYHDGRFATLADVVEHYNGFFGLGLTDQQKCELVEYLKSI